MENHNDEGIILYSWYRSSCTWRVRNALNLKRIPHKIVPVELNSGCQNDSSFLKLNPMGQVPALVIDGITVAQSVSIMEYLEDTRPQIPLLPTDPKKRAQVRTIVENIVSGIQPHQNLAGLDIPVGTPKAWEFAYSLEWAKQWIQKGFVALEKILEQTSGKYCVGNDLTLADCCLVPQVYNARYYQMDLGAFPNILRVNQNLIELEEFMKGHPLNQIDCPPEFKETSKI